MAAHERLSSSPDARGGRPLLVRRHGPGRGGATEEPAGPQVVLLEQHGRFLVGEPSGAAQ